MVSQMSAPLDAPIGQTVDRDTLEQLIGTLKEVATADECIELFYEFMKSKGGICTTFPGRPTFVLVTLAGIDAAGSGETPACADRAVIKNWLGLAMLEVAQHG